MAYLFILFLILTAIMLAETALGRIQDTVLDILYKDGDSWGKVRERQRIIDAVTILLLLVSALSTTVIGMGLFSTSGTA